MKATVSTLATLPVRTETDFRGKAPFWQGAVSFEGTESDKLVALPCHIWQSPSKIPLRVSNNAMLNGYNEAGATVAADSCIPRTAGPFFNETLVLERTNNNGTNTSCYYVPLGAAGTVTSLKLVELDY
eukprot:8141057-Pyramimonas_sp.AAC.2